MTDLISIIETDEFYRAARRVFSEDEIAELIAYLAANPAAGTLLPETGGVRYIRWGAHGHGKGRGARVVYLFGGMDMPLILLTAYFKGRKDKITPADRKEFRRTAEEIRQAWRGS